MTEEEYEIFWNESVVNRLKRCRKHKRTKDRLSTGENIHEKYGRYTWSVHSCRDCLEEQTEISYV